MVLSHMHARQCSSVRNAAAFGVFLSFWGCDGLLAPTPTTELKPEWFAQGVHMRVPSPWHDPVLRAIPPGIPFDLIHPYFKRPDFKPGETAVRKYIGDLTTPFGFFDGQFGPPETDELYKFGPLTAEGPLQSKATQWLTPLFKDAIEPFSFHHSMMENGPDADFGDVGSFLQESARLNDMGESFGVQNFNLEGDRPHNIFDQMEEPPIDLLNSKHVHAMRSDVDDMAVHPSDRVKLEQFERNLDRNTNMFGAAMFRTEDSAKPVIDLSTGFEAERMKIHLDVCADPNDMHMQRAMSHTSDAVKHTLAPVVTGGTVIGIRCSDGVLLAADTLACYGNTQKYTNVRRIHKVTDQLIVASEGEMADFQEMQTMLQRLVDDHDELDHGGPYFVRPAQAQHFFAQVCYAKRNKMDPMWLQTLFAGWGPPSTLDISATLEGTDVFADKPHLGMVDMHGTSLESHVFATGIGVYLALPLLRKATDEKAQAEKNCMPRELTLAEAKVVACEVMQYIAQASTRCSNRIQIATVGPEGVDISEPFHLHDNWDIDGYHMRELGSSYETPPLKFPITSDGRIARMQYDDLDDVYINTSSE